MEKTHGETFSFLVLWYYGISLSCSLDVTITRFEDCTSSNNTRFYGHVTTKNGNQYLDFDLTLPRPLDETVGCTIALSTTPNGKTYIPLFTIREKYACKAANIYLGEMWYDIQRTAQITPKSCPIRARRYYVHDFLLDFKKMALRTLPIGKIKAVISLIDNNSHSKTNNSLLCLLTESTYLGN